jgi:hypothetical protein
VVEYLSMPETDVGMRSEARRALRLPRGDGSSVDIRSRVAGCRRDAGPVHCAALRLLLRRARSPRHRKGTRRATLSGGSAAVTLRPAPASQKLITHGADVHAKDCAGRTPLHYAAANGRVAQARFMRFTLARTAPGSSHCHRRFVSCWLPART